MSRRARLLGRRILTTVLVVVLAAASVGLSRLVPGPTLDASPFTVVGVGAASSGPLSVEVHDVRLTDSIVVVEERRSTTGVFVLLDVTISSDVPMGTMARELVIDGRTFTTAWRGPGFDEGFPAPGLPVRGQIVFEVDDALVDEGTWAELHVVAGLVAYADLAAQPAVRVQLPGTVESDVVVEVLSR